MSTMTRQNYEAAAELIRVHSTNPERTDAEVNLLVNTFIRFFKADNARFDADRFEAACVVPMSPAPKNTKTRNRKIA